MRELIVTRWKIKILEVEKRSIVYKGSNSIQRASKSLPKYIQALEVYVKPGPLLAFRKKSSLEYNEPIRPLARCFAFSSEQFAIDHCW